MHRRIPASLVLAVLLLPWGEFHAFAEAPCSVSGPAAPEVRFHKSSPSGEVFVVDVAGFRHLRFGTPCGVDQSSLSLDDAGAVPTEYVRLASLSLAMAPGAPRVLMVGLGGGSFSNLVRRVRPQSEIDAVELDPVVIEAATRFFGVRPSPHYRLHEAEAGRFLADSEQRFDLIFLDTYDGSGMPAPLGTQGYFASAVKRLSPGGVLVANFGLDTPGAYLALARRLRAAAGDALCISGREEANLVVFAGAKQTLRDGRLAASAARLDAEGRLPFSLADLVDRVRDCL